MKNKVGIVLGILVVGLISLGAIFGFDSGTVSQDENPEVVAGDTRNTPDQYTNGVAFGTLPVTVTWAGGKISAGENTAYWYNNTGKVQYVDYLEASPDGTASSTYKIFAYSTSTAYATLYDITATPANNATTRIAISGFNYATSSTATSTSNLDLSVAGKVLRVADGGRVQFLLRGVDSGCASQGGACETATSTNRGFNVPWRIRIHD